ncbi:MAG: NUDIX domain-containing protein [Bacilli bacterium]|nr:NUDIX domain-containing protein [Bacilli bacterium]
MEKKNSASVFVLDENDLLLCLLHNKFHKWIQPGGHSEIGETFLQTAVREVYEETGILFSFVEEEPFAIKEYHNHVGVQVDHQFVAVPVTHEIQTNHESKTAAWLSREEIMKNDCVDDLLESYEAALVYKKKIKNKSR